MEFDIEELMSNNGFFMSRERLRRFKEAEVQRSHGKV